MRSNPASVFIIRCAATLIALCLWRAASASVVDDAVHAGMVPKAAIAPASPPSQSPGGLLPAAHCDDTYCGFDALRDIWKRDALKSDPAPDLNADTVILERTRFQKLVDRFGDPHAPVVFQYEIPGLGLCLTGIAMIKTC
jgi:hypothetical protein